MVRLSRIVVPGYPHHVTQRGVRSMDVFHSEGDRGGLESPQREKQYYVLRIPDLPSPRDSHHSSLPVD